jgi:ABC-2 type transport system ATP-binding protein
LPEIEASCSKVIIINHGRVVAWGMPSDLKAEFVQFTEYECQVKCNILEFEQALALFNPDLKLIQFHSLGDSDYKLLHLRTSLKEDIGEHIIRWIQQNPNWSLRQFVHHMPTLEDIFMLATKRSWEERMANKWKNYPVSPENSMQSLP